MLTVVKYIIKLRKKVFSNMIKFWSSS